MQILSSAIYTKKNSMTENIFCLTIYKAWIHNIFHEFSVHINFKLSSASHPEWH